MKLISEKELGETLSISKQTLFAWRDGGMPFYKGPGKMARVWYDLDEVKRWLKSNAKEALNGKSVSET